MLGILAMVWSALVAAVAACVWLYREASPPGLSRTYRTSRAWVGVA